MDRLDIAHTEVRDLDPIKAMVELTELSIDATPITDISVVANFTKLEKLSIANTAVKDLSPLKNLKNLKNLDISGTPITDYSMIASPKLKVKM